MKIENPVEVAEVIRRADELQREIEETEYRAEQDYQTLTKINDELKEAFDALGLETNELREQLQKLKSENEKLSAEFDAASVALDAAQTRIVELESETSAAIEIAEVAEEVAEAAKDQFLLLGQHLSTPHGESPIEADRDEKPASLPPHVADYFRLKASKDRADRQKAFALFNKHKEEIAAEQSRRIAGGAGAAKTIAASAPEVSADVLAIGEEYESLRDKIREIESIPMYSKNPEMNRRRNTLVFEKRKFIRRHSDQINRYNQYKYQLATSA